MIVVSCPDETAPELWEVTGASAVGATDSAFSQATSTPASLIIARLYSEKDLTP